MPSMAPGRPLRRRRGNVIDSIGFQKHTDSAALNAAITERFNQIGGIAQSMAALEEEFRKTKVINNVNLEFIKRDFNALSAENDQLKRQLENAGTFNKKLFIYPSELSNNDILGLIDLKYDLVTFRPVSALPISHIQTSRGRVIPEDLEIEIADDFEEYLYVETDRKKMLVGGLNDPWYREYHIDGRGDADPTGRNRVGPGAAGGIESVSVRVTINMPFNESNAYIYNNLIITPYPFNNLNIDRIEVFSDSSWTILSSGLMNSRHVFIQNKLDKIDRLRLTLTQNKHLLINSQKIFYIGISDLMVSQTKAEADKASFTYTLTPSENIIINSVEADIDRQFIKNDKEYFGFELFRYDLQKGTLTPIHQYNHIYINSGETIRFIFYLYRHELIPVLRKIILNYSRNI